MTSVERHRDAVERGVPVGRGSHRRSARRHQGESNPAARWRRRGTALLAAALPGALLGAHWTGLLSFLNPGLPFDVARWLRGLAAYAPVLAAATVMLQLPLLLRRPQRVVRGLPWTLSVVLLLAALLDASHASLFAYYLPAGINTRLVKAAFWLALCGLAAFYTALLHSVHRRRYGWRSRWFLALLAVASLGVVVERREAYQPRPEATPLRSVVERQRPLQLYVVAVEAATLDAILPLAEEGHLPFFGELLREGTYARLRSFEPTRRTALWTTLATGKYPYRHGVVGSRVWAAPFLGSGSELRLLPLSDRLGPWLTFGARSRPFGVADRRAVTLWEVLPRLGILTGMVGFPASEYPPPAADFAIAEPFFVAAPEARFAAPEGVAIRARLFQVGAAEVDPLLLAPFGRGPQPAVVTALRQDLWRETLAFYLLDDAPQVQALFLGLPGLARVSADTFGGYWARRLEGVRGERHERAGNTLTAYYRHIDGYLAQLWSRQEGPRLLAVVSAHGVAPPPPWRRLGDEVALHGKLSGAADGVLILRGEGIRPGAFLSQAGVEDVFPTLLYGLGLPVARDADGRVLTGSFLPEVLARHPVTFLPSYEELE
ncbi:MAG TPA: alkaline phosphatase family protein [Thermoanaerobaculia bacterium]|nr:alkaline phosphatase family protein [Thermoanaerobaculia bacterium]